MRTAQTDFFSDREMLPHFPPEPGKIPDGAAQGAQGRQAECAADCAAPP